MRSGGAARPSASGQLLERRQGLALVGQPAGLLAAERVRGVARGQIDQLAALAALRHVDLDLVAAPCLEEGDQLSRVGQRPRNQDARRDGRRGDVVLLDERRERLVVGRVAHVLEQEDVARHDGAVANREELHRAATARRA